LCSVSKVIG